jgi:hypothetical protein
VRKQQILKFSLILSVFSFFIFSFSYFGASAFGSRAATNQAFSENTMIGSVNVSNMSHEEAHAAIEAKVSSWLAEASLMLVYKGQEYPINPSTFIFHIEDSVSAAVDGSQNELLIEWNEEALKDLSLPPAVMDKLDLANLKTELLAAGQGFASKTEIGLEKYLPAEDPVIISTASIKLSAEDQEVRDLAASLKAIEISAETPFSFAAFTEEAGGVEGSSFAFSQIASAIYRALLPTNFTISERHISSQLPKNIDLGFEAKVDFAKNIDLKFYNPNETAYQIELSIKSEELQVSVKGAPLLYEYTITSTDKQEFKPRTIKQYSALLKQGQKSVEQEGAPGLLVTMNREIYGKDGDLLKTELLSEDFYPPVHRIEILPVAPAVQQAPPAPTGNPETVTAPGENQNTSIPGQTSGTTPPPAPAGSSDEQTDVEQNTDDGSLWGKPNEQPK